MKRKRSILTLVLAATLTFTLLAGCGAPAPAADAKEATKAEAPKAEEPKAEEPKAEEPAPAADEKPAEGGSMVFWFPHGSSPDKPSLENSAKKFSEQSGIAVDAQFIGGSGSSGITDKLTVAINGGDPPDLVLFDRFMVAQWASNGLFQDVTEKAAAAGVVADRYYPFAWDEANYEGKLYAFPFDTDNRAFYYNIDMLNEIGMKEPPKTIAELDAAAEKLTKKNGEQYERIGFIPWIGQGSIFTWGTVFGGNFIDASGKITADDPKNVEALKWVVTYADKYNVEAMTDFAAAGGSDINPFASKLVAMFVSGPWEMTNFNKTEGLNYGIGKIPTPDGSDFRSWAGGWSLVVPRGAKNVDAGVKLGAFMSIGDGAVAYGEETTHFMCDTKINDNLSWVKGNDKAKVFVDFFPTSICRPVISQGQLLWDETVNAQDAAKFKQGEPAELLKAVSDKVNAALGK